MNFSSSFTRPSSKDCEKHDNRVSRVLASLPRNRGDSNYAAARLIANSDGVSSLPAPPKDCRSLTTEVEQEIKSTQSRRHNSTFLSIVKPSPPPGEKAPPVERQNCNGPQNRKSKVKPKYAVYSGNK